MLESGVRRPIRSKGITAATRRNEAAGKINSDAPNRIPHTTKNANETLMCVAARTQTNPHKPPKAKARWTGEEKG
jgi:hypothetical protein